MTIQVRIAVQASRKNLGGEGVDIRRQEGQNRGIRVWRRLQDGDQVLDVEGLAVGRVAGGITE